MQRTLFHLALCALMGLAACERDVEHPLPVDVPEWFPEMVVPADNALTADRIALGRRLFYDPLLSRDTSISCSSCHAQAMAFTDGRQVGLGVGDRAGKRNAPSLTNIAFVPAFNADGGIGTLELQAQGPIFLHEEMDFTIAGFLERIAGDDTYTAMFGAAYGRRPDAFGISRGLAAFERTFVSGGSRFDQYEYQSVSTALSAAELRGRDLFLGNVAQCAQCHTPPLFTTFAYENIGLYAVYADSGRARITGLAQDNGRFKVPTLRNIALTAPYMHDGSMATLRDAVAHFNNGGVGHANQSAHVRPLGLAPQQVDDLVAFLQSLTDEGFVNDPELSEP